MPRSAKKSRIVMSVCERRGSINNNLAYKLPPAYNVINDKGAVAICDKKTVTLTAEQEKKFIKSFKIGVIKELHRKQLLTDEQLKKLIEMQK